MYRNIVLSLFFMVLPLFSYAAEEAVLKLPAGRLYGTLEVPADSVKPPVAIIIAGSGPTDRDGNNRISGKNASLKQLAEGLAQKGIASLRYDKRGVKASREISMPESEARIDHFVDDAVFWGEYLKISGRFGKLIIVGHSEGALIGSLAAERLKADGFVSLAGAGRPAYEVLEEQFTANAPDYLPDARRIMEHLKKGELADNITELMMPAFRPSIQPYVISWFKYNPAEIIGRLKMPVLVIHGTTDLQISVKDAELLAAANKNIRLNILDGVNHVLKEADTMQTQKNSYYNPDYPVSPKVIDAVAGFIRSIQ
jgi:pimeloyl-ACP methyl ester carboxylesterase